MFQTDASRFLRRLIHKVNRCADVNDVLDTFIHKTLRNEQTDKRLAGPGIQ